MSTHNTYRFAVVAHGAALVLVRPSLGVGIIGRDGAGGDARHHEEAKDA